VRLHVAFVLGVVVAIGLPARVAAAASASRGLAEYEALVVYLLSCSPQNVAATGWHAIDVRVKGRSLKVKARRGYQR